MVRRAPVPENGKELRRPDLNGLTDRGSISENAILVENLSKSYLLGHQAHKQRRSNYTALRDVIAREARNFVRKAGDMVHGRDREVLIVNNNCTDETDGVIEQFTDSLPVRLLHERRQGLSNARIVPSQVREVIISCGPMMTRLWTPIGVRYMSV